MFRKMMAAIVAAAIAIVPVQATAQPRNMVVFGDSVIADPTVHDWAAGKIGATPQGSSDAKVWCPTGARNWGKQAAARLGLQAMDYSCAGTVSTRKGPYFSLQVDRALRDRTLSPATARVVISTGFNDTYSTGGRSPAQVRRAFVDAMVPQVNRIRAAAPNARIQIVGYPKITQGDRVCLFQLGNNMHDATPMPFVQAWEDTAQWMQVDLARAAGVEFLDLKPSTWNNNMCAPDHIRMWAGLVDFGPSPRNMPLHVNQRGHAHVADVIAHS